jgi:hypothetical protein
MKTEQPWTMVEGVLQYYGQGVLLIRPILGPPVNWNAEAGPKLMQRIVELLNEVGEEEP